MHYNCLPTAGIKKKKKNYQLVLLPVKKMDVGDTFQAGKKRMKPCILIFRVSNGFYVTLLLMFKVRAVNYVCV